MRRCGPRRAGSVAQMAFVRGAAAAGLRAVVEEQNGALSKEGLHRAVKTGIGIAGGTLVANAVDQKDPARAFLALAGGAACMIMVDRLLGATSGDKKGSNDGEEEKIS